MNKYSGIFYVDGLAFNATEISNNPKNDRLFKITCEFEKAYELELFVRIIRKPRFDFSLPGSKNLLTARCIMWLTYTPFTNSQDSHPYGIVCEIVLINDCKYETIN